MGIKIHVSSDCPLEGKSALVMHLQKVLLRSGIKKVTARDERKGTYLAPKDGQGNLISTDDFFTDRFMGERFSHIEIIEISEHPDLDPPKCECH
jgi:hypothetical protein